MHQLLVNGLPLPPLLLEGESQVIGVSVLKLKTYSQPKKIQLAVAASPFLAQKHHLLV